MDDARGGSAGNGAATASAASDSGGTSTASSGNGSSGANVSSRNRLRLNKRSCITHLAGSRPYRNFLRHCPIYLHNEKTANTTRGRTWIELLIIYRMMGNEATTHDEARTAPIRWSLGQSLHHFRLQIRRTIKAMCPPTQHRSITGQACGQPLMHLGITTHLTTLPLTIPLTKEAETEVATRIIQSQASSSYKAATTKLQQKQWVIQHRLRTKGRTKWLASIPQWKGSPFTTDIPQPTNSNTTTTNTTTTQTNQQPDDTPTTNTDQVRLPDIIMLHCPTCKHAVDGTKDKFQMDKLNHRTWCKACQRQRFVRLWQCRCGIPWHTCMTHRMDPDRLRRTRAPTPTSTNPTDQDTTTSQTNYQVGNSNVQQWLRQQPRQTKNNMDIVFTQKDQDVATNMINKRRKHPTNSNLHIHPTPQEGASASSSGNGSVSAVASSNGEGSSTPGDPRHQPASEKL